MFHDTKYWKTIARRGSVSPSTVHRWMKELGYEWGRAKKSFYTDNHENEKVVKY